MGLTDFAGVFSRAFVVGYFAPAFFGLFLLRLVADERAQPVDFRALGAGAQVLVLGGLALLLGLLLSGLERPLLRLLEGYPLRNSRRRALQRIDDRLTAAWRAKHGELETALEGAESSDRTRAAHEFHHAFPARVDLVLPTRFGNTLRSAETHPRKRYGLDGIAIWPRIELLLSDTEQETIGQQHTNVAFFANSIAVVLIAGVSAALDRLWHQPNVATAAVQIASISIASLALAWALYNGATRAAADWGDSIRAAFDIHRLDLYEKLGVRVPVSPADELSLGRAVNRCILFAEPIDEEFRREFLHPTPASGGPQGPTDLLDAGRCPSATDAPGLAAPKS
jgi:hypothetical protein